jgi:protein-S-isoprenylcysteine O-methyltransferase
MTNSQPDDSHLLNRPVERSNGTSSLDAKLQAEAAAEKEDKPLPRAYFPGGDRSLSGIAIRAFLLGAVGTTSALLTIALAYYSNRLWRPFFFVATLSVFHFLEFWTTAEFNTPIVYISSFLLTNGDRYRQAHTVALIETVITSLLLPGWQARVNPPIVIALGIVMIMVGQAVRSIAMAQAGTNFNHQVQSKKNKGHELVTRGLYRSFRHPSYFGFFWWGIGTQVALGNTVSLVGYTAVLWYFFWTRITRTLFYIVDTMIYADFDCRRRKTPHRLFR